MICKKSVHIFRSFNYYLANVNETSNVKKEKHKVLISNIQR